MSPKDRLDTTMAGLDARYGYSDDEYQVVSKSMHALHSNNGRVPAWGIYIAFTPELRLMTSERTALLDYIDARPDLRAAAKAAESVGAMAAFLAALDWEPPYTDPAEWIPQ